MDAGVHFCISMKRSSTKYSFCTHPVYLAVRLAHKRTESSQIQIRLRFFSWHINYVGTKKGYGRTECIFSHCALILSFVNGADLSTSLLELWGSQ